MGRILSACLFQTMKFDTDGDAEPEKELEAYLGKMDKKNIKYAVEEKKKEAGGSVVIEIRKQYNAYRTEGYLD